MESIIYKHKKIAKDMYDIFFTATNITHENNIYYITGEIGYQGDEKTITLIYNVSTNEIIVHSNYRLMVRDNDTYNGTYKMTATNPNCKLLHLDDSIPYYRFPRTKDGISIPHAIHEIFKVFEDQSITHKPQISIPCKWYTYSNCSCNNQQ
jgi:hypothetical protein